MKMIHKILYVFCGLLTSLNLHAQNLCLPSLVTSSPISVGLDSAVIGGQINSDGGNSVILRGICYSTIPYPTMGDLRTENGSGIGTFSTILRSLSPATTYYARSYAKNSQGVVVYGNEVTFTTLTFSCGTSIVFDVDSNSYNTVLIGTQCWIQSNLKVSKYRNGDSILTGFSNSAWQNTTSGAYALYNNDPVNDALYGKLYNHYSVSDNRGLCPTGWHVPSDGDWNILVKYLVPSADTLCGNCSQSGFAGGMLKSTATIPIAGGWMTPNTGATNSSGFTAEAGGLRNPNGYYEIWNTGTWWTSSLNAPGVFIKRSINKNSGDIFREFGGVIYSYGFSVRCVKD